MKNTKSEDNDGQETRSSGEVNLEELPELAEYEDEIAYLGRVRVFAIAAERGEYAKEPFGFVFIQGPHKIAFYPIAPRRSFEDVKNSAASFIIAMALAVRKLRSHIPAIRGLDEDEVEIINQMIATITDDDSDEREAIKPPSDNFFEYAEYLSLGVDNALLREHLITNNSDRETLQTKRECDLRAVQIAAIGAAEYEVMELVLDALSDRQSRSDAQSTEELLSYLLTLRLARFALRIRPRRDRDEWDLTVAAQVDDTIKDVQQILHSRRPDSDIGRLILVRSAIAVDTGRPPWPAIQDSFALAGQFPELHLQNIRALAGRLDRDPKTIQTRADAARLLGLSSLAAEEYLPHASMITAAKAESAALLAQHAAVLGEVGEMRHYIAVVRKLFDAYSVRHHLILNDAPPVADTSGHHTPRYAIDIGDSMLRCADALASVGDWEAVITLVKAVEARLDYMRRDDRRLLQIAERIAGVTKTAQE